MTFRNLQDWLRDLRGRGELVEVACEVDPYLEIAEIHRRVIAAGGPALLFKHPKGKDFPVATNFFGTRGRIDRAFGDDPLRLIERVAGLPEALLPLSLKKLWGLRDLARRGLRVGSRRVSRAPVLQERLEGDDLTRLPALTCWSKDGGPFFTWPVVHTPDPGTRCENLGIYRMQVFSPRETGMHIQIGKVAGFHLHEAERRGQDLPMNVYLGGPPALMLAAVAPLPENVSELLLASVLLGERLARGHIAGYQLEPVAEAEFCLVGHYAKGVRRPEGPFGDHYGYDSLQHDFPVFRAQKVFHRPGAIYPATVVGKPRQEDYYLGEYLQELLRPMAKLVMPQVHDLWSYAEAGFHTVAAAVVRESYAREAMQAVFRMLGEGQVGLTKVMFVLSEPLDLRDFRRVLTHVLERLQPERDLYVLDDVAFDTLDYAGGELSRGSKAIFLGTGAPCRQLPGELPAGIPAELVSEAAVFCPGCLAVQMAGDGSEDRLTALARSSCLKDWPLVVIVDDVCRATSSATAFLWSVFTRFDPARDIHAAGVKVAHNRARLSAPLIIDARMKPGYPDELFCDEKTSQLVNRRWRDYFPDGRVEMGDGAFGNLYK